MEKYEIGSKLTINGHQFEIIDLWMGNKLIKNGSENEIIDVEYVNLKGKDGNILGPVELGIAD